jgi:hypothetical protein
MADVRVKVNPTNLTNVRVGQSNAIKVVSGISGGDVSAAQTSANVVGGIASITSLDVSGFSTLTNLYVSGVSTLGTVEISSGIISATSGVITFYGDGSNLTNTGAALSEPSTGTRRLVLTDLTSGTMISAATTSKVVYDFDNSIFTVSGISTLGVTTSSSLSAKELSVSGITTTTSLKVGTSITASDGIVTATSFSTGEVGTGINIGLSSITGPSNLIIDPSAVGDDTGKVTIKGDLFVLGTETNVSSQTIELADHRVGIATTVTTNELLDGGGISIGDTDVLKTFTFHNTTNTLRSSVGLGVTSGQEFKIGINTVLNSTTLGSGITFSSLTKLGTLSNLNITGLSTFTGIATFSTDVNIGGTLTALDIDGGEY